MGTRLNPGKFDCYSAALPDEEQFVLNARDPAFSPTIRFWITQREAMIGRGEKPTSDNEMLAEAGLCATRGVAWRSDNAMVSIYESEIAQEQGDDPVFVGPRWQYEQPPETREQWENAYRGYIQQRDQINSRLTDENASLRVALAEQGQEIDTLRSQDTVSRATIARLQDEMGEIKGHVEDLEGTLRSQADSLTHVRSQLASSELERGRLESRLDVSSDTPAIREWLTEGADDLDWIRHTLTSAYAPGCAMEQHMIAAIERGRLTARDGAETISIAAKIACGLRQVTDDLTPFLTTHFPGDEATMAFVDRINGYAAELEGHVGCPVDLAEPPEINDHRFGHLEKHGDYAYARGLTVAPQHLPKALHQMEHDFGWRLVAIFGETTAEKIGFIFKRADPNIDQIIADTLAAKTEFMSRIFRSIGFHDGGVVKPREEPFDIISSTGGEFIVPIKMSLEDADTIRSLRSIAGREAAKAIDETKGETERLALYTHRCGINPEGLYPETAELVRGFASAVAHRLLDAQKGLKRPLGWLQDDWEENCRARLYNNLAANSKIDAAAFLAFMWHRQWTTDAIGSIEDGPEAFNEVLRVRMLEVARHTRIAAIAIITEAGAADLNDLMTKPFEVRTEALGKALSFLTSTTQQ